MYQALLMVLLLPLGLQESDEAQQYRQDYAQYEDIVAMTDTVERATAFMDFVDQGFDDRLIGVVAVGIQTALEELSGDVLYPLGDRWDAQTGAVTGAVRSLQSAAGAGDHANIVKYGEIVYAANPITEIAEILAGSNSALGNNDKYLEYANVVIEDKGVAESFDFAYNIFQQERSTENWDAAAGWANRLKALSAAPPGVSVADWRNMGIEFQRSIARAEFEGERYPNAITQYRMLADMDRSLRAISNIYMGRSHFAIGGPDQVNQALARFADAAVLNDPNVSDAAMTMVEEIYTTNTGTLERIDENVLDAARERMR